MIESIILRYECLLGLDIPALPPKCNRTKFSDEQKEALESFLLQNPRLTHDTLEEFSREQNLTISAVRNWVNNRKQRMKRGSSTVLEESPGKYPRIDGADDFDDDGFHSRSQEFDGPGYPCIDSDVPTMVNSTSYDQTQLSHAVVNEFETSNFTCGINTPKDDPPVSTTFKQENGTQNQCEYNSSTNVTAEC